MHPCLSSPIVQCVALAPWCREGVRGGMELEKPGYVGTLLPTLLQGWQPPGKWQSLETLHSVSRVPRYMPNSPLLWKQIRRFPKTLVWTATRSPGKMGLPWHTQQVRKRHAISGLACLIQPASRERNLFYRQNFNFTNHAQATQNTSHCKSQHSHPFV